MSYADSENDIITAIIQRIALLQSRGDSYFPEGMFASYRQNKYLRYKRPDTNIFFTASIVFVLNQLKPYLAADVNSIIDGMIAKAVQNYGAFQNKDGLKTYNFWQTSKDGRVSRHFPNGYIFRHLEHFRLPDDIDDTALIYLTTNPQADELHWLKQKLLQHANLSAGPQQQRQVRNTLKPYRKLKVYSTWFGKNMPIEFDACALCNLMYLIEYYHLPHNEYDTDTYQFLGGIIERQELITHSFQVSHNYATAPLIIYHLARLLGKFNNTPLETYRERLIALALQCLQKEQTEMNKIMLETAIFKLYNNNTLAYLTTVARLAEENKRSQLPAEDDNFCYFLGPLLSSYENPVLQFFAPMKITQMDWKCEAHEWTLLLENLIERKRINKVNA
ncbi:hypothetical protein [Emticicia sp. 17c]|uniref:hypothetical protein n=1 Tax=Emticicia sp. 17c TaxID=3127704 RepID=UPI00301C291E